MPALTCPLCAMDDVLSFPDHLECATCGHEWKAAEVELVPAARVFKDAHGNILENGDIVAMVTDLKLKGTSETLKTGTKSKPIRLVEGDHEIDCRMNGLSIALKACYVKKVPK
jgi:protein PhnA